MMTKEDFQNYAKAGFNIIPVAKEIFLEDQTPLTLYSQISNKSNTFLYLDISVIYRAKTLVRFARFLKSFWYSSICHLSALDRKRTILVTSNLRLKCACCLFSLPPGSMK